MEQDWNLFQIRRALLTGPLGLVGSGLMTNVWKPAELRDAAASILYVNLISLFEDAIEKRHPKDTKLRKRENLAGKLSELNRRNDLQDYGAFDAIRKRRNELGHEQGKDASPQELAGACEVVRTQLLAWSLIEDGPDRYTINMKRSGMIETENDPGYHYEQTFTIDVLKAGELVAQHKERRLLARVSIPT